jgi:uroporphyrin-III C-methyltransferase/precorrin-2 dehydrogenase/sirohydrochlorin ferrochelatase
MNQFPIFVNLTGQPVLLIGTGEAAEAKARLYRRAGAQIVTDSTAAARLAVVAIEEREEAEAAAAALRARGLLVNVVDQPDLCDFTTPAIVERGPLLVAIGTGGASAGLAKHIRLRLEALLPQRLGELAEALARARDAIRARWADGAQRRQAIDAALAAGGALDPLDEGAADRVADWLSSGDDPAASEVVTIVLASPDPDELTLRQARLLGRADRIIHDANVPDAIIARARADAQRLALSDQMLASDQPGLSVMLRYAAADDGA